MDMLKAIILKFMLKRIALADSDELDEIIKAVVQRKSVIFPEWESLWVSLPRNDKEARIEQIRQMLQFCRRHGRI